MLNLSALAKTAKAYALNASVSNEVFLNSLIWPYAEKARVKGCCGDDFCLNKSQVSRLLNGRMEVPIKLRLGLGLYGLEDEITFLLEDVLGEFLDLGRFEPFAREVIELCGKSQRRVKCRLEETREAPARFMAIALMEAIKAPNAGLLKKKLNSCGIGSVYVESGNLLDKGFSRKSKDAVKPIVVIPVDTEFKTHVTRGYEKVEHPMVADTTLHGQWLTRMMRSSEGVDESTLSRRIADSLSLRAEIIAGNVAIEWPIGTIAVIETNSAIFYLLAISIFDENNNAHATVEDVKEAVRSLIDFHNRNGQGHDLYLPLMGTGLSRTGMSPCDAYEMLKSELCSKNAFIAGKVTIMVLPEVAAEMGLMD